MRSAVLLKKSKYKITKMVTEAVNENVNMAPKLNQSNPQRLLAISEQML